MATKIWVSKHFTPKKLSLTAEFDVEAKQNKRWVQVGGPFPDRASAVKFAQKFSAANPDVETRVVVHQ
jgi:hypothetical protein